MTKLFKAMSSLGKKTVFDFSDKRRSTPDIFSLLKELRVLATITEKIFVLITQQDPHANEQTFVSLNSLNEAVSTLSHLYLVLFRQHGTAFVPAQHYYS